MSEHSGEFRLAACFCAEVNDDIETKAHRDLK